MTRLRSKRFDEPDQLVTLPRLTAQVVHIGEAHIARPVHQPGRSWAEQVKPVPGRSSLRVTRASLDTQPDDVSNPNSYVYLRPA
jgi:hypothetical protein